MAGNTVYLEQQTLPLVIAMLEDCDKFAVDALIKYIHKSDMLQTDLNIDEVYEHQQKIRIIVKKLKLWNETKEKDRI